MAGRSLLWIGVLSILLSACGGGGGGSSTPSTPDNPDPEPPVQDPVERAIESEDHTLASAEALIDFSLAETRRIDQRRAEIINQLYRDIQQISWYPSHDSAYFSSFMPAHTYAVLRSTQQGNSEPSSVGLVMAGEQDQHRYAAMGANLMAVDVSADTIAFTKSLFSWLTNNPDAATEINMVTAHVPSKADSRYFQHNQAIRNWLNENYPGTHQINQAHQCDGEALLGCLQQQQPDILILSDTDRAGEGFTAIEAAVDFAKQQQIPILVSNYRRGPSAFMAPMYAYMGISGANNYWSKHQATSLGKQHMTASEFTAVEQLLSQLQADEFDSDSLVSCSKNFINCSTPAFEQAFKHAANWYRQATISLDNAGIDPFKHSSWQLLKAGLLLADKYRAGIDYPIELSDSSAWQRAMFADWVISYARENNPAQPDLGEYVTPAGELALNSNAHYRYAPTVTERQQVSVPYTDQWTTTGWYVQPGHTITLTRHDSSAANVQLKLNYHRSNTNRAFQHHVYRGPLALSSQRLQLAAGETISFSSPYGGPLYLYISGDDAPLSVDISAQNVAKHPSITDFNSAEQIARFEQALNTTELPHVDLKTFGAEQHLRRDKFLGAIGEKYPSVEALLKAIQQDHIDSVYTLAGYKIAGKTLSESLPQEVQSICASLSAEADCLDASLHTRTRIQHANYDQNAHCGSGCSGNPWDSSGNISPAGWLDNHELGHNLQTNRLNVAFVEQADRNDWSHYDSRATENSNNIFPYYVKWHSHYFSQQQTTPITDGHTNHKDLFYVFTSDAAQLTNAANQRVVFDRQCKLMPDGGDRYSAPWRSNAYAVYNSYRMSFYIQLALQFDKRMVLGQQLSNGFHIYTLLYQHSRIFGQYAKNESLWLAHKDELGFSEFPFANHPTYAGKPVANIPGNDFMLVTLSRLAGQDWRPYFDMYGLHYSALAEAQIEAEQYPSAFAMGMYMLETEMPPADISPSLPYLPLDLNDGSTLWRDGSSPGDCL